MNNIYTARQAPRFLAHSLLWEEKGPNLKMTKGRASSGWKNVHADNCLWECSGIGKDLAGCIQTQRSCLSFCRQFKGFQSMQPKTVGDQRDGSMGWALLRLFFFIVHLRHNKALKLQTKYFIKIYLNGSSSRLFATNIFSMNVWFFWVFVSTRIQLKNQLRTDGW